MHIVFILLLTISFGTNAEVYKCTKADGSVYYQDHECNKIEEKQSKLLSCIESIAPIQGIATQSITPKQEQTRRTKLRKEAKKKRKSKVKNKLMQQKVKNKINGVYAEYRQGYTAKRRVILEKKLERYKQQQRELRDKS